MIDDGEEFTMEIVDYDEKLTLYFLSDDSFIFIEDVSELCDELLEDMDYFLEDVGMNEYEEDDDKLILKFEDQEVSRMSITKDSKELIAKGQNTNESFTFTIGNVKLPK